MMTENFDPHFSYEGSLVIPFTNLMGPFQYVPPSDSKQNKGKKKNKIQRYFRPTTTSKSANACRPTPTQVQPTLDAQWKK